jgi:hypothetical protein
MEVLLPTVSAIGPCAAALGLGWFLRQSVCNETDGEVRNDPLNWAFLARKYNSHVLCDHFFTLQSAAKFALWITLPSLILQSFNK